MTDERLAEIAQVFTCRATPIAQAARELVEEVHALRSAKALLEVERDEARSDWVRIVDDEARVVAERNALVKELNTTNKIMDAALDDALAKLKAAEAEIVRLRACLAGIEELRGLSEAATPGTWVADRRGVWRERRDDQGRRAKYVVCECHTTIGHEAEQPGNPPFIAAAVSYVRSMLRRESVV